MGYDVICIYSLIFVAVLSLHNPPHELRLKGHMNIINDL